MTPSTEVRDVSPSDDPASRQTRQPILGTRFILVPPKVTNQPQDDRLVLVRLSTQDGNGGRTMKPDLDSARRQLVSMDLLARVRVWGARLGLGSGLLDALEQFGLKFANAAIGVSTGAELMKFLSSLVAAGKLDIATVMAIPAAELLKFPNVELTRPMEAKAVSANENLLGNEMSVGGAVAKEMFDAWLQQSQVPPPLRRFPSLDRATAASPSFVKEAEAFEARLVENLRSQFDKGEVDYRDLVTGPGPDRARNEKGEMADVPALEEGRSTHRLLPAIEPRLPSLGLVADTVVKICIGSFQGTEVSLTDFEFHVGGTPPAGQFSGHLRYELRDHFGVDDEDCEVRIRGLHGTPGQVAMWVLQHFAPSGHRPFIDQVVVERPFFGTIN